MAVLLLVGLALASGSVTAAPCDATGERPAVVATVGDERYGPGTDVPVYRGSDLAVDLCTAPGDGSGLNASGRDGLEVLRASDDRLELRVGGPAADPANATLAANGTSLGSLAEPGNVPGPNLTIAGFAVETSLVDGAIAVPERDRAAALRRAERRFGRREATAIDRFAALGNGSGTGPSGANASVASAATSYERFRAASRALREQLSAVAASDVASARTARALLELREREVALDATARSNLRRHDGELVERERSLTWSLRLRVLGVGFAGLLLGGLAGAALPAIRGRRACRALQRGEWTTYSRRTALPAAAAGAILLALGLGWLALAVGGPLLEVVA